MGVLIRGMEIPKNCKRCPLRYTNTGYTFCELTGENLAIETDKRDDACPLVEVPPHSRLVDIDKMIDDYWDGNYMRIGEAELEEIPTIIEAEE